MFQPFLNDWSFPFACLNKGPWSSFFPELNFHILIEISNVVESPHWVKFTPVHFSKDGPFKEKHTFISYNCSHAT